MTTPQTNPSPLHTVDVHFHVGIRGDSDPTLGRISDDFRKTWPTYDVFLLYAGLEKGEDVDEKIIPKTIEVIKNAKVDHVVCLALDHVFDENGIPRPKKSDLWVSNEFVLQLTQRCDGKALFGASVHPYDPEFETRVHECVQQGAVLLKWLPSSQQFTLAKPKVRQALKYLATAKNGKPLPLLLHTGMEYAVPTKDERTRSWDFLSWGAGDRFGNFFRLGDKKWHTPKIREVRKTIDEGLEAGCHIIFAHCGLPYFAPVWLRFLEHDDLPVVREYLKRTAAGQTGKGRCYADVSALVTPFRKGYFKEIAELPPELLLFGSDFPTPVFELSADIDEVWRDFKAVMAGDLKRVAVPQNNLIDVNYDELKTAFGDHPMFTNFDRYLW